MSDLTKVPKMCSTCAHQEVCKFREQAARFEETNENEEGPFTSTISCKHYTTIQLFNPRGFDVTPSSWPKAEPIPTPWEKYKDSNTVYCGVDEGKQEHTARTRTTGLPQF